MLMPSESAWTFAGKTATSRPINPQPAHRRVSRGSTPIPPQISATPLIVIIAAGDGTQDGMIARYMFGQTR